MLEGLSEKRPVDRSSLRQLKQLKCKETDYKSVQEKMTADTRRMYRHSFLVRIAQHMRQCSGITERAQLPAPALIPEVAVEESTPNPLMAPEP